MSRAMLVATLAFLTLLALPLLLVAGLSALQFSLSLIPVVLILLYSGTHLARISASSSQQIVTTTFWMFVYIFLGVCPLLQVLSGTFPLPGSYTELSLFKTGLIILVGLLSFDAGRYLCKPARDVVMPKTLQRPLHTFTIGILSVAALLLSVYFLQSIGGVAALLSPRNQTGQTLSSELASPEQSLLNQVTRTPVYVVLIAMLSVWIAKCRKNLKVGMGWKVMTFVMLVSTLILNNPINSARLKVGTILLSLLFVLPWRRWSGAAIVGGLVFALLVVFPFADLYRTSLDASLTTRLEGTSPTEELTENGDFDAFQMVTNTAAAVDTSGLQFGRQITGVATFWVPRSAWPDKPVATGPWVAEHAGYGYTNLSAPLWAEFYVDGGWVLLIFGFIGYGYFVRTIDQWYEFSHRAGQARIVSIIVPIYAGYQFFLLRGSLLPAVAYLAPIILFALFCSVRLGVRRSRRLFPASSAGVARTTKLSESAKRR